MSIWRTISIFAIIAIVLIAVFLRPADRMDGQWLIGEEGFRLIISDSSLERQQGLSHRDSLANDTVMVFIFPTDDLHGIWMKNMNFAIDILWLDESRRVVHIEEHVSPDTYPTIFRPDSAARYVVELNSGIVKQLRIQLGQQLEAWPSG